MSGLAALSECDRVILRAFYGKSAMTSLFYCHFKEGENNMNHKRIAALLFAVAFGLTALTGCTKQPDGKEAASSAAQSSASGSEEKDCCKKEESCCEYSEKSDCCKDKENSDDDSKNEKSCCHNEQNESSVPDCCKNEESSDVPDCCGG